MKVDERKEQNEQEQKEQETKEEERQGSNVHPVSTSKLVHI